MNAVDSPSTLQKSCLLAPVALRPLLSLNSCRKAKHKDIKVIYDLLLGPEKTARKCNPHGRDASVTVNRVYLGESALHLFEPSSSLQLESTELTVHKST